jgi:hypothetical protein
MCIRTQCQDEEDHDNIEKGLSVRTREWVMTIITNNLDQDSQSSHWSLFVCNIITGDTFHFDSSSPYNSAAASHTKAQFEKHIKRPLKRPVNVPCPQQINGFDCGVYALVFAEKIFDLITSGCLCSPQEFCKAMEDKVKSITPIEVAAHRRGLLEELEALSSK